MKNLSTEDYDRLRLVKRDQIEDVVVFVNVMHKLRYDKVYKNIKLIVESYVFLRLHVEYIILDQNNKKLNQQRMKLFKILEKIDHFVYRLKLSSVIKIHSVIFIAQLKSALSSIDDSYHRHHDRNSSSVEEVVSNDYDESRYESSKFYELKRLLEKRTFIDDIKIEYLVK